MDGLLMVLNDSLEKLFECFDPRDHVFESIKVIQCSPMHFKVY